MPIELNLLAEHQLAELQRRRDPVRLTLIGGIAAAGLMLVWYGGLQAYSVRLSGLLERDKAALSEVQSKSQTVISALKKSVEVEGRLSALQAMATNRFLWASTLDALQHSIVPNVEVSRITARQGYQIDPAPADPKAPKKVRYSTERVSISIDARDYAPVAELNHTRLMGRLGSMEYFQGLLNPKEGVVLKERQREQVDPADPARTFIQFRVDCVFTEKKRTL